MLLTHMKTNAVDTYEGINSTSKVSKKEVQFNIYNQCLKDL